MGAPQDSPVADELAAAGAQLMAGVGKTTDILVVVAEKPFSVGILRSASYEKAMALKGEGEKVEIISLEEIRALIIMPTSRG